ncbi:MAG: copper resistance CopC family protein [Candidatus Limnocylindria bacterium]
MRFTRLAIPATFALACVLAPMTVLAHAGLISSTPAGGAEVATPPDEVVLVFSGELAPDGTGFTVTDADGTTVGVGSLDLTVADRDEVRGTPTISNPGVYAVAWTSVAADGHEGAGSFEFRVISSTGSPDTAVNAEHGTTAGIGAALLLVAVALGFRRLGRRAGAAMLLAVAMVAALTACVGGDADCEALPTRIELTLADGALTPSNPSVCRDRQVTLVVTPDVDGVLHVHGYDAQVPATSMTAGEVVQLVFTATRSGQFPIELHTDDNTEGVSVGIFTVHEP